MHIYIILIKFFFFQSTQEVPGDLALVVISDIGCALSIIGLAATFVILILNKYEMMFTSLKRFHFSSCDFLSVV